MLVVCSVALLLPVALAVPQWHHHGGGFWGSGEWSGYWCATTSSGVPSATVSICLGNTALEVLTSADTSNLLSQTDYHILQHL
jgi:hypothetical protein